MNAYIKTNKYLNNKKYVFSFSKDTIFVYYKNIIAIFVKSIKQIKL